MTQTLTKMRALSVMNPWAAWIADGKKTIERRSWSTEYRGPLLICSSRGWDKGALTQAQARDPRYQYGVALCVVELADVRDLREDDTAYSLCAYETGCFAWVLKNPRPVAPLSVRGRLGLFDVEVPEGWAP